MSISNSIIWGNRAIMNRLRRLVGIFRVDSIDMNALTGNMYTYMVLQAFILRMLFP